MWEGGGRFNTDSSGKNNSGDLNEFPHLPHLPLLRQSAAFSIKSCLCTTKQSTDSLYDLVTDVMRLCPLLLCCSVAQVVASVCMY